MKRIVRTHRLRTDTRGRSSDGTEKLQLPILATGVRRIAWTPSNSERLKALRQASISIANAMWTRMEDRCANVSIGFEEHS